jgi:hypothetical protein
MLIRTFGWSTWETVLGVSFLLAVFLARTLLKAKNYRDWVKKGGR